MKMSDEGDYHELILVEFASGKVFSPDKQEASWVYDDDDGETLFPDLAPLAQFSTRGSLVSRCVVIDKPKYLNTICGAEIRVKEGRMQLIRDVWYGKYLSTDNEPTCQHWREVK